MFRTTAAEMFKRPKHDASAACTAMQSASLTLVVFMLFADERDGSNRYDVDGRWWWW